ncbi:MAG: hypothetical protein A2017_17120 [Lentisphaerae bacterium GWF2_44_16]|nr:MAG: hypothetical protein A2017_17120 [Lentisphaerae bacterium GWF2_44_16]
MYFSRNGELDIWGFSRIFSECFMYSVLIFLRISFAVMKRKNCKITSAAIVYIKIHPKIKLKAPCKIPGIAANFVLVRQDK